MKPLAHVPAELARALRGVVFDLDDTVLDHGVLAEATYAALFRLREAGLQLIACTGRPAGWGEVLQRQWPLDATLVENGAIAFVPAATRVVALDPLEPSARRARRAELLALADTLVQSVPSTSLADDNNARITDVTLDIGEHRKVPPADIDRLRHLAHQHGVRTLVSSVHLHLTHEVEDKATGALRLLSTRFGEDPTRARLRYAFIGDSGNDGAAFAAFLPTFGVANVHGHLGRMSVPPRFVAPSPMGRGFVEIALRLAALRAS